MWEVCDFFVDGLGSCYWLASGLFTHAEYAAGNLVGGGCWWLAGNWFAAGQGLCLGGTLGCLTATAIDG